MKTPYEVLGVPRSADGSAIRAALRRAAKKYHPDINSGDPEAERQLKEAIAAYELLMKPDQRATYDRHLRHRRRKLVRHFLIAAFASAGLVSGVTLTLATWLAGMQEAVVVVLKPGVAAVEPGLAAKQKVSKHDVSDDVAARATAPGSLTPASLASEWSEVVRNGDPKQVRAVALRNPEASEGELARSWLLLLIDATDDTSLPDALRAAAGAIAERARQRLNDLSAAPAGKERAPAALAANGSEANAANGGEAKEVSDPHDAASYLKRGLVRLRKGDLDGAIADFDAAIGLEPGNALAHGHRAAAWGAKGDRDRALAGFEAAIRIDPGNSTIVRERGIFWRRRGELDLALVDFDQAIRLGFSDARAYNERGLVWYKKGRNERAIADFTQAIKIDPNLASAYENRGAALRDKGDLGSSAADLERAARIMASLTDPDPARDGK